MFCEKCGTQLPDDAAFCTKCGASTAKGAKTAEKVEKPVDIIVEDNKDEENK